MTSRERLRAALSGEAVDRTPFLPCIAADHACVAAGHTYEEALRDPRHGLRWNLAANLRYGSDAVRVWPTPPRAWFESKEVRHVSGRLAQVDRHTGQVDGWFDVAGGGSLVPAHPASPPTPTSALPTWPTAAELLASGALDTARAVTAAAHGQDLFVIGIAAGQTLNSLVRWVGDAAQALLLTADEHEFTRQAFAAATDASIEVIRAFAQLGVDAIYIGDSYASGSVISPEFYREACCPCYRRAADAAHAEGLLVYEHCCGSYNALLESVTTSHLDGLEGMDPTSGMSVGRTRALVGDALALIGGVSCLTLWRGSPDEVYAEACRCIDEGGPRYILGSACAVPRETPAANLHAMSRAACEHAPG